MIAGEYPSLHRSSTSTVSRDPLLFLPSHRSSRRGYSLRNVPLSLLFRPTITKHEPRHLAVVNRMPGTAASPPDVASLSSPVGNGSRPRYAKQLPPSQTSSPQQRQHADAGGRQESAEQLVPSTRRVQRMLSGVRHDICWYPAAIARRGHQVSALSCVALP